MIKLSSLIPLVLDNFPNATLTIFVQKSRETVNKTIGSLSIASQETGFEQSHSEKLLAQIFRNSKYVYSVTITFHHVGKISPTRKVSPFQSLFCPTFLPNKPRFCLRAPEVNFSINNNKKLFFVCLLIFIFLYY